MTKVKRIPCATFGDSFWFPSSRLGTPLQAKLLLCERTIYLLRQALQAGAWGKSYVPKQELGNEGKSQAEKFHRPEAGATQGV